MDEVARTSLSVHFLSKPTVLWVNKNACVSHRLLTTNTFCFVQDTLNIISLIDGGLSEFTNCQLVHYSGSLRALIHAAFDAASLYHSNISF